MKKVYEFIATGMYVGFFRPAPGTFGSFTAVLIAWWLHEIFGYTLIPKIISIAATIVIGLVATAYLLNDTREKDPQYVVIDEWAGQFVALSFVSASLENFLVGFILFRIFDITKIFPIKNAERLRGAYGVMADDLIAGLFAGGCLYFWNMFF